MGLASINIKFQVDLREFSTEMQNSLRAIDKFGQKMQSVGRGLTAAITLPILAVGAASLKMASDYQESINKVDVAFKASNQQVKEFAKTSLESFGVAEGTALDMSAAFGDMATSMGLPDDAAASMSTSLVGLAADLASFKNISIDVANAAISAVFTGETESLKKLGIVLTVANLEYFALGQGIKKSYEQMSQAEKVQLRYNYILSVTKNAQGDFARTSDGAANQTRIFQESLKQVSQQLGVIILPLFTKVIAAINEKIKAFSGLSDATKTTIVIVAGLAAALGPLVFIIGAVASAIPAVVAGFALLSGAIVPILAGIALLYGAYVILKNATKEAAVATIQLTDSQKLIQKVTDEATSSIVDQKQKLEALLITARNENETKEARLKAIADINKISPEYLGNLTLENINTDKARISLEKYNKALIAGATARAASRLLEQNQSDKIKAGFEREKALADYNSKRETAIAQGWEAEKKFYEDNNRQLQFANEALDRKNSKYDSEAKLLTEIYNKNKQNLDLLDSGQNGGATVAPKAVKAAKVDKVFQEGTIAFYNQQIAKLKAQQDEVSKTGASYYLLGNEIVKVQEKINGIAVDRLEPLNLKEIVPVDEFSKITAGFAKMQEEIASRAGGMKASLNAIQLEAQKLKESIADAVLPALTDAFSTMGTNIVASLGLAKSGFQGFVGGLFTTVTKLIGMMLASSISQSISGATAAGAATGPAAIFTTPAFIATAIGGVIAAFAAIPKFETGGVVGGSSYYGDKILARVNSSELILNTDQQKKLYGTMNSGSDGGFVASTVMKGSDMLLLIERATARKNRLGS